MSWLTRLAPRVNLAPKRDTPDDLWTKCPECGQLIYARDYRENLSVCPHCNHHGRIGPADRFAQLFDHGEHTRLPLPRVPEDPLQFRDTKRYPDRLKAARVTTNDWDAFILGQGRIGGVQSVLGVQNFHFMAGSMGAAVGSAFVCGAEASLNARVPYVVCSASGGARMQEGTVALMQLPRTTVAVSRLEEAGLPYIVVLTDPTTGGVTASFAMLGDVHIAEPGALIGFAGARVIEQTIREKLPPGFQRAEYLLEHGMVDMVVPRRDLAGTLGRLLRLLTRAEGRV